MAPNFANDRFTTNNIACSHGPCCILCKYMSPIKLDALTHWLYSYPNAKSAHILLNGFTHGFRLGYEGERVARDSPNLKSVELDVDAVLNKLSNEIELGRIAGPFKSRPLSNLIISPIGLVPKSEPGKFRLIQHLSYPDGSSINDGIDRIHAVVRYASFDDAVNLVASIGRDALLAKADIKSAFRLLPVHPDDFQLLGIHVKDQFYVDKALPMGASCSPKLFETFSTFIEWVAKKVSGSDLISHYADDFVLVGLPGGGKQSCNHLVKCFEGVCRDLGVPLAEEKSVGPVSKLVYLGLEIDAERQVVAVPEDKLSKIRAKVASSLLAAKLSLKELQSLIGSLSFICKAVSPGRAFIRRLIDLTIGVKKSWHQIKLTVGAKADLRMWLVFLKDFNGVSIIPDQLWLACDDLELFTDASGSVGCAGYFKGSWFRSKWPDDDFGKRRSIAWLEFFPIVVSVVLWSHLLKGKRIIARSDNMAVVSIINKQSSKCPHIMKLVRFFVLQCLKCNILFCAKHIPGVSNGIADALSRSQMDRFWELAPHAAPSGMAVPDFLWNL